MDDVARRERHDRGKVDGHGCQLQGADAARFAIFQYMIANLDWAMRAGPAGDTCCHNSRPLTAGPAHAPPVPYDFDFPASSTRPTRCRPTA